MAHLDRRTHTIRRNLASATLPLAFALAMVGCVGEPEPRLSPDDPVMVKGRRVFATQCAACHQSNGEGVMGVYPPLTAEDSWTTGDPVRLIRIVLNGLQGEVVVGGVTYNNVMTASGFLTDEDIASVLTYIRQSWGNRAEPVSADDVAVVRERVAGRTKAWAPEELSASE